MLTDDEERSKHNSLLTTRITISVQSLTLTIGHGGGAAQLGGRRRRRHRALLAATCPGSLLGKVFTTDLLKLFAVLILFLLLHKILRSRSGSGVHNVAPVPLGVLGKLLPALDEEDAGVADLALPLLLQLEAGAELSLVLGAVSEPRAARLGLADAAALRGPEHLRLVESCHGFL